MKDLTDCLVVHDPPLTALGRSQAEDLNERTKETIQVTAELLVTSPLQRTLATTTIGFRYLKERLERNGKVVIVLPELQEVSLRIDRCRLRPMVNDEVVD